VRFVTNYATYISSDCALPNRSQPWHISHVINDAEQTGPLSPRPSIAIIGSGAVGSYYGARLVQGGHDVHFLLRSDYEAVRQDGMHIKSCAGDFSLPADRLNLYADVREMPKADWVIVTLKATNNELFEPLIRPLLKPGTALLTLQNGLGNEEQLAQTFPGHPMLGGMAFTCINRTAPGRIDHTAHGYIRLGEFGGGPGAYAERIAAIFRESQVPCDVLEDLRYGRWEKLVWNVPFNGLSTVLNQTTDQLLASAEGEQLVRRIMAEVIASARANGVTMSDSLIDLNISRTREMEAYRTSMQVDLQMGRDLEVEAILGEPMRAGARCGVVNDSMRMLYELGCMVRKRIVAGDVGNHQLTSPTPPIHSPAGTR
jgi:2-dehydropantoate 2-reductase